jgi:hypothetical protein|nr:MAG TPA: hypothetical protein [Caudoviricetes sp.]
MEEQVLDELESVDNSYWVELDKALRRLLKSEDFKKVILEGYLKEKALSGVSLLGRSDVKKRGERPDVIEELVSVANLQQYLFTVIPSLAGSALAEENR